MIFIEKNYLFFIKKIILIYFKLDNYNDLLKMSLNNFFYKKIIIIILYFVIFKH